MRTKAGKDKTAATGNALLHAVLGSMSYAFSVWDEELNLVLYNQTYDDMYYAKLSKLKPGMSLHEVCTLSVENGNHPGISGDELYQKYRERFAETSKPGAWRHYEKRVNGHLIRSTHIRAPQVGWIVTHEDVTDEIERKEEAREHAKQLATRNMWFGNAVNNMAHGLCMFGPDKRLIICNHVFADIYGLPVELLQPGTHLEEIFKYRVSKGLMPENERTEDYWSSRIDMLGKLTRERSFLEREQGRLISVIHKPMPDGGWVSTHQDITEQRQREELIRQRSDELEKQNMRFNVAVDNMPQGLSMFDAERKLVICNEPYARMYGLPETLTVPGTSFWDMLDYSVNSGMVSIADPQERFEALNAVIRDGVAVKGPVTMVNGKVMFIGHQPMDDGGWLATHEDITEQHRSEKLIRHLARHDGLTGLANRTSFLEMMAEAEEEISAGKVMAVLCIDLDRFKPINDSYGHAAGDAVLAMVAERINRQLGETGVAARLGGDEFAALIGPVSGPEEAGGIARRILADLSKPYSWEGVDVSIGASIGIAMAPADGVDTDTLMRNGDLALYRAKSDSQCEICFFVPEMEATLKKRRSIEAGLKLALERDELQLYYQPLLSLKSNRVSCCEALMRWNSEERGVILPSEFIPIAEETGLIRAFGEWALQSACMAAAQWPDNVRVAVNVSPVQFSGCDLVGQVEAALKKSGLDAGRLELEITESLFLADNDHNLKILHALHELGVRIAMDDFGTGYSSLSYLRAFPFDKIKIDRSFISSLADRPESIAIIKAVVDLGESMGMSTAAEGIETEEQLEAVRAQGCVEVQGYLFSPPLPRTAIGELLRSPADKIGRRRVS